METDAFMFDWNSLFDSPPENPFPGNFPRDLERHLYMLPGFITLALTVSTLMPNQQPANATAPDDTPQPTSGPHSPEWKGLTVKEKLHYDWRHLFDFENVVFAGVGASFDQWRDKPSQWGEGWGPFFGRYGSHLGQYAVQRSIMFPVQAIDHEDTRYFRSKRTTFQGRLGDAFLHTIWRHNDSGGMMPAYSEFLGDYGAAAARMWWPDQYHTGSAMFVAGSDTILVDAGINVFHEFKPDIMRWLHFEH
jgi:hypothetical protein